jgi:SAM-dependent methyltransferase
MQPESKIYKPVVRDILTAHRPKTILDAPSGGGWLKDLLDWTPEIDGIDLFEGSAPGYRNFWQADLDQGLPEKIGPYEAIVSCEGIEHIGNPLRFMTDAMERLAPGGVLVISTPNIWYPESRLKFLLRGFFPSFPSLAGKIERGTHMHIMPWSFPQLFLYFRLAGFENVRLHDVPQKKPRRAFETPFAWPQKRYCAKKALKAKTDEERIYWEDAGSPQSLYGRNLVVSGSKPAK